MPFKMLGVTDERDTCELCGKQHLKRCVVLENETGGIVYYGTDCAARVLLPRANDRVTRRKAEELDRIYDDVAKAKKWVAEWRSKGFDDEKIVQGLNSRLSGYFTLRNNGVIFSQFRDNDGNKMDIKITGKNP